MINNFYIKVSHTFTIIREFTIVGIIKESTLKIISNTGSKIVGNPIISKTQKSIVLDINFSNFGTSFRRFFVSSSFFFVSLE